MISITKYLITYINFRSKNYIYDQKFIYPLINKYFVRCTFMKLLCFKIRQWGYGEGAGSNYIYVTSMKLKDLVDMNVDIDRWTPGNRDGYQRPPKESRFRNGKGSIVRYILKEVGVFPTSILLNIRGEVKFEPKTKISENIEFGELYIPETAKLVIIDGQHRIEALKRVYNVAPEIEKYPLPVTLMNLKEKFDEMIHFFIVNSRQKSIDTSLVFRHLQAFLEKAYVEDKKWVRETILGEQEERKALAVTIVDYLDEIDESPFKGRIYYVAAGEEKDATVHLVDDITLARYIAKILSEKSFPKIDMEDVAILLAEYWSAIKELYPNCFKNPQEYTLLKHTGIASFTYLFPTIYAYCVMDGKMSKDQFKHYLSMLMEKVDSNELEPDFREPIDEKWWSRAHGKPIAKSTSEAVFDRIFKNMAKKIEIVRKRKLGRE